ncbi:MAG: NAD(P)/FAD-dependent oxidoreductase [Acidobacteriota bacterium]
MWDALIVGAGPAGSALASLLADMGYAVLLVDGARFPRDKLCGEYLGPGCRRLLQQIGVLGMIEQAARPLRGMRVRSPGGATFTAEFPPGLHGLAIRRLHLDHLLLEHARRNRIECLQGFRVERLVFAGNRVCGVEGLHHQRGREVLPARLVIGADGRNSVVARRLGVFRWHRAHRKMALCVHYEGVSLESDYAEVYIGRLGYGILNPLPGGLANVNLVGDLENFAPARGRVEDCFGRWLRTLPALEERLMAARPVEDVRALGPLAHHAARASFDGGLLVGDAAGFYDPFTGEGIGMALRSAEMAAGVVRRALERGDCSAQFLRQYDVERAAQFRGRFRLEAAIQAVIGRPWLANLIAGRLRLRPEAAGELLRMTGGLVPPRMTRCLKLVGRVIA